MEVTKATITDIPIIQELAASTWPVAYSEILSNEQLQYMLRKFYSNNALEEQMLTKGHQFYIIKDEKNAALGFASFSNEETKTFKLQKLYVLPNEQGKNLGKALFFSVVHEVRNLGGIRLILNVNRYNKARFFYEKLGFEIIEETDIDIGNSYFMNDFVMELNL